MPTPAVVAFRCEWFDKQASLVQLYRLNHFEDNTIEMINLKTNRTFLKRTYFEEINRNSLYIGASVTINCRQLHLVEYADEGTKQYYSSSTTRIFGLIKPEAMSDMSSFISKLQSIMTFNRLKMVSLNNRVAEKFSCSAGKGVAFEATLTNDQSNDWNRLLSNESHVFYGSTGNEFVNEDSSICFDVPLSRSQSKEMTACIIKPHIVTSNLIGEILNHIVENGFMIEEMELFHFDKDGVVNFFEVYKGVFQHYEKMINHMIEGPSIYIKLTGQNVVEDFRESCGPNDVEVAKYLRPKSIRAKFGINRVLNAVHCTDLPEDGSLECDNIKQIIQV